MGIGDFRSVVYPLWILVALVAFWCFVPSAIAVGVDLLRRQRLAVTVIHKQWAWAYAFLSIALAWASLFLFWPIARAAQQSMTDFSLSSASATRWVGFANYAHTLADQHWLHTLGVTLVYLLATLPPSIAISIFLALQVLKQPRHLQTFFKTALYVPGVVSPVVSAVVMKWVFHSGDGFANAVLQTLHLPPQNWFGDQHLAMPVLILMSWLTANGVGVVVYTAAIGNIPATFYEAARIDGASPWQTFRAVTWPLVRPTTTFVAITGLIAGFQVFAPALLITGGGPLNTTYFMNYHIYRTFYYGNQFGLASAMAILLMLLIILASIVTYRALRSDVEY